jgi:hypothetical protein
MTKVISQLLDRGSIGVVVTGMTGLKLLALLVVDEAGQTWGSLRNEELDLLVSRHARLLNSKTDTRTIAVTEFAPRFSTTGNTSSLNDCSRPRGLFLWCWSVGAALARLGSFVGSNDID